MTTFSIRGVTKVLSQLAISASLLIAVCVPVPARADVGAPQFIWDQSGLAGRFGASMAFDGATGTAVLFGGGEGSGGVALADTWTWDGSSWTEQDPAHSPSARLYASMAYDAATQQVVLFGGYTGDAHCPCGPLGDTWTWDGTDWTQRAVSSPGADEGGAMSYDPVRQEIVMLRGYGAYTFQSNTWTWDGSTWTQQNPVHEPPRLIGAGMAFNPTTGTVVLFGGASPDTNPATPSGDTWTWDGFDWTKRSPAHSPSARYGAAMAGDTAGGVTLFGGCLDHVYPWGDCTTDSTFNAETWTWDGFDWTQQNPQDAPAARFLSPAVYDSVRDEVIIFGGADWSDSTTQLIGDTWGWDGADWALRSPAQSPPARFGASMTYDDSRGQIVVFGGVNMSRLDDTWTWDGTTWTRQHPLSSPSARDTASIAYDSVRHKTVLYGGDRVDDFGDDTWTWDGSNWTQMHPIDSPPKRVGGSLAFDTATGTAVLFGGQGACAVVGVCNDTWTWDGSNWTEQVPAHSPSPSASSWMAYDPLHQRVVLFEGDTWTWDGSDWTQMDPIHIPPGGPIAFDPATGTVIMVSEGQTWSWDGSDWTQLFPPVSPPNRTQTSLAFDANAKGLLFQGWDTDPGIGSSSWSYGVAPDVVMTVDSSGGTVSTPGPLDSSHPLSTTVEVGSTPDGGTVSIAQTAATHVAPKKFWFLNAQAWIAMPRADSGSSHTLDFQLDPSIIAGDPGATLYVFRTASSTPKQVSACNSTSPPDPDPCISDQHISLDGVVHITVSTTSGPIWNFGLPLVSRSVNISYKPAKHHFTGSISSSKHSCVAGQKVTVFRKRSGPDRKIGSDTTSSTGVYFVRYATSKGSYYASVPRQLRSGVGFCGVATSKILHL